MGQARNRGTREQRIGSAIADGRAHVRLHAFINETRMESVLLKNFLCADFGASVIPDQTRERVLDAPVRHGVQFGDCASCGASHMIVSASTKAGCIKLEPVLAEMKRSLGFTSVS
jgi:hypothetical protein